VAKVDTERCWRNRLSSRSTLGNEEQPSSILAGEGLMVLVVGAFCYSCAILPLVKRY
jgi:hypothetical protein